MPHYDSGSEEHFHWARICILTKSQSRPLSGRPSKLSYGGHPILAWILNSVHLGVNVGLYLGCHLGVHLGLDLDLHLGSHLGFHMGVHLGFQSESQLRSKWDPSPTSI